MSKARTLLNQFETLNEGMYIVYTENDAKHSAWEEKEDAKKQARVLKNNGYRGVSIEYDDTANYDDGHYFV